MGEVFPRISIVAFRTLGNAVLQLIIHYLIFYFNLSNIHQYHSHPNDISPYFLVQQDAMQHILDYEP